MVRLGMDSITFAWFAMVIWDSFGDLKYIMMAIYDFIAVLIFIGTLCLDLQAVNYLCPNQTL
jgi:hypothetical protein